MLAAGNRTRSHVWQLLTGRQRVRRHRNAIDGVERQVREQRRKLGEAHCDGFAHNDETVEGACLLGTVRVGNRSLGT